MIPRQASRPQFFVLIRGNDATARKETEQCPQSQIYHDWSLVDSLLLLQKLQSPWYYMELEPIVPEGHSGYDLILRFTELAKKIEQKCGAAMPYASRVVDEDIVPLDGRLRGTNQLGEIRPVMSNRRCYDCKISLSTPTAGKTIDLNRRSIDLLSNCLNAI